MQVPISPAIRAYLDTVAEPLRSMLEHLHAVIRKEVPEAGEKIAYGIPTFTLNGNLVHYAAFKRHCSFFPGRAALDKEFADRLAGFKISKGTIQFTAERLLPDALVAEIVRLRVAEDRAKVSGLSAPGSSRS